MTSTELVAIAVVVSDRHVLIGRRVDEMPLWSFLGGKVEAGESSEQAAVREVREEAQLAIVPLHIIGRRIHPLTGRELVYVAAATADDLAVSASDPALAEVRWATLSELEQLCPDVFKPARRWLTRRLG